MRHRNRRFDRAFKVAAIQRVQNGEMQAAVARDLKITSSLLLEWRRQWQRGGEVALREVGRPGRRGTERRDPTQESRTAELERLVGRQQAAIDFLERALHRVEELGRRKNDDGGTASSQ